MRLQAAVQIRIRYIRAQLENTRELELWHYWTDGDSGHRSRTAEIPVEQLTVEKIAAIEEIPVWDEPLTDYCYRIISN